MRSWDLMSSCWNDGLRQPHRLRVRSVRFLHCWVPHPQVARQVQRAPGFLHGVLLADREWTLWTMTAWDSEESMRPYMTTGHHKKAMPHLMQWCDEASVAHWNQEDAAMPSWEETDRRMGATLAPEHQLLHINLLGVSAAVVLVVSVYLWQLQRRALRLCCLSFMIYLVSGTYLTFISPDSPMKSFEHG
jgi:hypothetical protein